MCENRRFLAVFFQVCNPKSGNRMKKYSRVVQWLSGSKPVIGVHTGGPESYLPKETKSTKLGFQKPSMMSAMSQSPEMEF
ncbi:unnamed protein product [Cuscuta europaea]|uniref:Uncharacterized protein n=1 Tax=Cuscuta europaea TaxID=41803 RepID=A0A9P0Z9P7_CUSEU|nr:unnamed protein product [Cuscuta europaea]